MNIVLSITSKMHLKLEDDTEQKNGERERNIK